MSFQEFKEPWIIIKVGKYDVKIDKNALHYFEDYPVFVHLDKNVSIITRLLPMSMAKTKEYRTYY